MHDCFQNIVLAQKPGDKKWRLPSEPGVSKQNRESWQAWNIKLEKDKLMVLIKGAAPKLASDDCFPSNATDCFRNITFDSEAVEKLLEQLEALKTFHGNAESFHSKIYSVNSNLNFFGYLA